MSVRSRLRSGLSCRAGAPVSWRWAAVAAGVAAFGCAVAAGGCGKKGPPLAPLLRIPARIDPFDVRRLGRTVYAQFTVPSANQDGTTPADVARVEVWAFTGDPGPIANVYRYGTLVAAFPVRRPPPAADLEAPPGNPAAPLPPADPVDPGLESARALEPGFEQGDAVTVTEALTPAAETLVLTPDQQRAARRPPPAPGVFPLGPGPFDLSRARIYVAVGVNRRGQRGPASPRVSVALVEPPPPPPLPVATYSEREVSLVWDVPAGARRAVQIVSELPKPTPPAPKTPAGAAPTGGAGATGAEATAKAGAAGTEATAKAGAAGAEALAKPGAAAAAGATPPKAADPAKPGGVPQGAAPPAGAGAPAAAAPPPPPELLPGGLLPSRPVVPVLPGSGYQVIDVTEPQAADARPDLLRPGRRGVAPTGAVFGGRLLPPPLNDQPIATTGFADARLVFGQPRCYVVRTVDRYGPLRVESEPSPRVCVTPVDHFAPSAPRNLAAVSGGGAVSLIWDANGEADLAGYLVLRGEAAGGDLKPLTPAPIAETTFRDESGVPGGQYVYVVVAIDTATPPNTSPRTSRVAATVR